MKAKWIIDKQIIKDTDYENLEDIIKECGYEVTTMQYVPFLDKSEYGRPFDINDCIIMYGTIDLLRKVPDYFGNFLSENRLRYHKYSSTIGIKPEEFLNNDFVITTYHDFKNNYEKYCNIFGTDALFIRPDSGFKTFAGMPIYGHNQKEELNALDQLSGAVNDTLIIVAAQKPIISEARFIVAGKEIIDGSVYREGGAIALFHCYPVDMRDYAQMIVNSIIDPPEPVYTIDIASTPIGFKVIEVNSFSSAGWYACDPYNVVKKVSIYVEQLWKEQYE